jgi:predicted nucleic acid-binding protein
VTTYVDSNVLIDLVSNDPAYAAWSIAALDSAAAQGKLAVDPIVFAEVSIRFATFEAVAGFFQRSEIEIAPTPPEALFLAGKVFMAYRRKGGVRTGVLPDFLIGAHAAVRDAPLLTRDHGRYRTYFPRLRLISHGI